jgi:competence protein ComEC
MYANILLFWHRHPALLYGLILLLGSLFVLQTPLALIPFILLLHKKHLFGSVLLFLLPSILVYQGYTFPPSGSVVEGIYSIYQITPSERYGGGWSYQGILKTSQGRIHCRSFAKEYQPASYSYKIKGRVHARASGKWYVLKIKEGWQVEKSRFTLVDRRTKAQKSVKSYIASKMEPQAAHFLTGMVTGQLEDRIMQNEFRQLGLSHLMAISGLHFSLIALALHLLLRLVLPPKVEACILILGLSFYFLFIGMTPSILRAWIMAMVFLMGLILEKRSSPLNALGVALIFTLLFDPLAVLTLSFQLSYLATAGILLFYTPCAYVLRFWLPKYPLKEVVYKHKTWQVGYIAYSLFRESLALTLAVHITVLPLTLAIFHQFPLNSLFYNLFFPFLASVSLLLFLFSVLVTPWLIPWVHWANSCYCHFILKIIESPPLHFSTLYIPVIPSWLLTSLLTTLFIIALYLKTKPFDFNSKNLLHHSNDLLLF